ncbi:MAG TPA: nucleoside phosphorylase [Acidimicrobiales bacterium]|nr:nucleoside phosphorylase [Acidimicrobiales bacterium]
MSDTREPHTDEPLPRDAAARVPLLEDDLDAPGIIQPGAGLLPLELDAEVPPVAVLCFFQEVLESMAARGEARPIGRLLSEIGPNPLYVVATERTDVVVVHPGVGAPLAAGILEEVIALGCTRIVACGGAGALRDELVLGHAVVVDEAVRDEGTSFHYLAPSRTVHADPHGVAVLEVLLAERGVPFLTGKSWTTDAFYREARPRIDRRVAEGCLTVEMEAAAFMAVARFRGIRFAQLLYAGDSVAGATWEARGWSRAGTVRESIFRLALDAAARL